MKSDTLPPVAPGKIFAVAPMMDWTDRHCRFFHRQLTRLALLYTEMVVADAILFGPRERLLGFSAEEHPVALQLGGSDPLKMAEAARIGEDFGYREINMNVGCPSDRVKSGTFGACLMEKPVLVAQCVSAMKAAVSVPVTVKCRLGVDEQDIEPALDALADGVFAAGADALWVHARKAWLKGLSPKENREVPPLDYDRVYRLKARLPEKFIGINGGIGSMADASAQLERLDGVMLGRAAYHDPRILLDADALISPEAAQAPAPEDIIDAMTGYCAAHVASGGRMHHVTRHMIGLMHGMQGARIWRQMLTVEAGREGADAGLLWRAFDAAGLARAA
jgi:tRNA-dihydrouridine synthase A